MAAHVPLVAQVAHGLKLPPVRLENETAADAADVLTWEVMGVRDPEAGELRHRVKALPLFQAGGCCCLVALIIAVMTASNEPLTTTLFPPTKKIAVEVFAALVDRMYVTCSKFTSTGASPEA
jgi:hypothetical protein